MPFDFPSSPTEGQEFAPPGGPTYVYATPAWKLKAGIPSKMQVIIADTAPASPAAGLLWWESDSGRLHIWYDDGNTQQWVQVSGIGPTGIADAPSDTKTYGRKDGAWVDVTATLLTGKYLPIAGGTLLGGLKLQMDNPTLTIDKLASSYGSAIYSMTSGSLRWRIMPGDWTAESATAAGSDFTIDSYKNDGSAFMQPLKIERATGQTTLSGDLAIEKATAPLLALYHNKVGVVGDYGATEFLYVNNSAGTKKAGAFVQTFQANVTPGSETVGFNLGAMNAGALTNFMSMGMTGSGAPAQSIYLSKGQLQFPGTANPSSDASTLDEYREGTWVPDLRFGGGVVGITYATRTGSYVKVGRHVTVACRVTLSSKGTSTGIAYVYGLPFTANDYQGLTMNYYAGLANIAAGSSPAPLVNPATTFWDFRVSGLGVNSGNMSDTHFTNTSDFIVSGSYIAAS